MPKQSVLCTATFDHEIYLRNPTQEEKHLKYFRNFQKRMGQELIRDRSSNDARAALKHTLEVADIIDELNTLNKLFTTQYEVLRSAVDEVERQGFDDNNQAWTDFKKRMDDLGTRDVVNLLAEVRQMTEDAKRTRTSVKELPPFVSL